MKARRETRVFLFIALLFFSALCAAQTPSNQTSIDFTRYIDDEGIERLQVSCALPDEPSECEVIKLRNEFVVDRTRLRKHIVEGWIRSFFRMAGDDAQKMARKPAKESDSRFLEWEIRGERRASQGNFFRAEIMKPLKGSRAPLHESLMELEALLSLSFVKP